MSVSTLGPSVLEWNRPEGDLNPKEAPALFEMVPPVVETTADTETYGRFVIEPLESGFGVTIGNAMRRVLLGSLEGAAITWVKIQGAAHEFSTVPHAKEDTIDFLLNVKGIRLRALSDRPGIITLDISGERDVTAADIMTTADFEIVNPDHHLITLNDKDARLSVEFNVEHNKGYVPGGSANGLGIGVITVDGIFTPVRKVNYLVETTRIGVDNYDRLIIEVWTDATITPSVAMGKAADILVSHFTTIGDQGRLTPRGNGATGGSPVALPSKQYETPIEDLDLSVRAYNCLKRAGITKVGQILEMSEEDLLNVRNFGRKSLDELRERLDARGFVVPASLGTASAALADRAEGDDDEDAEWVDDDDDDDE